MQRWMPFSRTNFDPSRREFNRKLAALGLAAVSMPVLGRAAFAAPAMTAMTYTNYHVKGLFPAYADKYGDIPKVSYMSDDEDAFQKLRGGFPADTAHPNTSSIRRWRDAELIRPIDTGKLSHWADIFDEVKAVKGITDGSETFVCPTCWGNASIIYRTDLVDEADIADPSWALLANPKYQGRVAAGTILEELVLPAALRAGVPQSEIFSMTDEQIAATKEVLRAQHGNLRYYWSSLTDMEQGLASGELVAAVGWNTSVNSLKKQGVPVAYLQPKEGILTWLDGVVRTTQGKASDDEVYDFMNAWIAPEAGKYLIEEIGYGHTNRKSFEIASAEKKRQLGLEEPTSNLSKGIFFEEIDGPTREKYSTMVEEVKSGF